MTSNIITELTKLPISEKIKLVNELWNNIREDGQKIPIPDGHKKELHEREKSFSLDESLSLEELKIRMKQRK